MGTNLLVEQFLAKLSSSTPGTGASPLDGNLLPELIEAIPWKTRLSEHFLLHYWNAVQGNDMFEAELIEALEKIHGELMEFFAFPLKSKNEHISIQEKLICFVIQAHTKRTFGSIECPNLLFYLMNPKQDPAFLRRFRHETAHLIWGKLYGEAPPLFNEGLAVYAECMSLPNAISDKLALYTAFSLDKIPPLSEIAITENFWKYGNSLYGIGGLWIYFLVERWGWEKLRTLFLSTDYRDEAILDIFAEIYGQRLDAMEKEWRCHLKSLLSDQ